MPTAFQIERRFAGFAARTISKGERVELVVRELIGPTEALHLLERLEHLQGAIFSKVPGLPPPSLIDHLLVLIERDLTGIAYVNELSLMAEVKVGRPVQAGTPCFVDDIEDITSIDLGVEVSPQTAVVFLRSFGWKRSLFYDLEPLHPEAEDRSYPLNQLLAQQALLLLGMGQTPGLPGNSLAAPLESMEAGFYHLKKLLNEECKDEAAYQELLAQHPWMLGGGYSAVERHLSLDDQNTPDFTAVRCHDAMRDIVELKQPFTRCFLKNGSFSAAFNDAWNQAERYLGFVQRRGSYLLEEKRLAFDNPACILLIGYSLAEDEITEIRRRQSLSRTVSVRTYDQLLKSAEHILNLARTAGQGSGPPAAAQD